MSAVFAVALAWLKSKAILIGGAITAFLAVVALVYRSKAARAEIAARIAQARADNEASERKAAEATAEAAATRRAADDAAYEERNRVQAQITAVEAQIDKATPDELAEQIDRAFGGAK